MRTQLVKYCLMSILILSMLTIGTGQSLHAAKTIIKIGTIVPLRSPWIKELKDLSAQWSQITGGQVEIKIYAGGTAGTEEDMVRKMRMGILNGAVFTNRGINLVYPDSYVLNIPFVFKSEEELDYILSKFTPQFEKEIEKNGFKMITWAKAGWIYFFSKNKVVYPDDLKKQKLSFTTGAPEEELAWKKSGYHVVPNSLKDMMMALQSGMVDAFYLPPLMAASGQYFPLAPNMCSLKIAPIVGGVVFTDAIWKKIPAQYKEKMLEVAQKMSASLLEKTNKLEKEAMDEMIKNKLIIHQCPPDALDKWKSASAKGMDEMIGKAFSKAIYDSLMKELTEYRNKK